MKIIVEFDNEEEFKARIKNPRGGKGDEAEQGSAKAPAPLMPPQQQQTFQPQYQPVTGSSPFATPAGDPIVTGLVKRIADKIDAAIASGGNADTALQWFRGQCGGEASGATLDQIKTVFLPKISAAGLENIAKLMGA